MKNKDLKKPASVISRNPTWLTANNGLLIAAPDSDKSIVIYDVLVSSTSGKLGTSANGAGTYLCSLKQGANSFGIPIFSPKGQGVYTNISGYITVTYAVVDAISASLVTLVTSGGTTTTTTTIEPTTLSFAAATSSITEGNSGVSYHSVTVNRGGNTSGTATVDYATGNVTASAGTDYTAKSGTLSFAAGVTSQSFLVTIAGDTDNENDETFNITLSNPTQTVGTASITGTNPHVVTIANNDTSNVSFAAATSSVSEGASSTTSHDVTVNRSDTNGTATVDYATSNVTANAGTDYTASSGTLNFANGEGSKTITLSITGDGTNEDSETFNVTLSNATSQYGSVAITGTNPHVVTITNDDTSNISFSAGTSSITEGDSGTKTHAVTVNRSDTNGTATVDYATSNGSATAGSDYTAASGTLSFANGVGSMNVSVTIISETDEESNETFNITLSNPTSQYGNVAITGTNPHVVTITDDDTTTTSTTTTTTTEEPGALIQVTDCAGGSVLIDDYNSYGPVSVGEIISWSEGEEGGGGDAHCGTVAAIGQSGTSTGSIESTGFTDCAECNSYYGL